MGGKKRGEESGRGEMWGMGDGGGERLAFPNSATARTRRFRKRFPFGTFPALHAFRAGSCELKRFPSQYIRVFNIAIY